MGRNQGRRLGTLSAAVWQGVQEVSVRVLSTLTMLCFVAEEE